MLSSRDSRRLGVLNIMQSYKTCREDGHGEMGTYRRGIVFFEMGKMIYP